MKKAIDVVATALASRDEKVNVRLPAALKEALLREQRERGHRSLSTTIVEILAREVSKRRA